MLPEERANVGTVGNGFSSDCQTCSTTVGLAKDTTGQLQTYSAYSLAAFRVA